MLTAYDYPTALHAERADVDVVLVGDSLGMVVLGHRTTQSVTIDHMIHHSSAARRAVNKALLVADLPFGSYETSPTGAIESAVRLVKASAVDAVKLEGGINRAPAIKRVVDAGIAVMGHVGLLPQAVSREGAFRATGRTAQTAIDIIRDARAVEEAGAFAIVLECVPERVAALVSDAVNIPIIGIGSGVQCGGQVLVYHDMLGVLSHPHHAQAAPKFSRAFADVGHEIDKAIRDYCTQVKERTFPSATHSPYTIPDEEYKQLKRLLASEPSTPSSLPPRPSTPTTKTEEDEPTHLY
ncbi:Ketopantoate hydroxymethyltransferase [Gracilaria domingensis]|nr:Ketopantoate hydroxymethyltransferase [Gracilaria domingensis]